MGRFCRRCAWLVLISALLAGGVVLSSGRLEAPLHDFVTKQLEQRGLHMEFRGLGLTLAGGVVATDVRFFSDDDRKHLLAVVDELRLNFDYGQLLAGKVAVTGVELAQASVALPLNPMEPDQQVMVLEEFNARANIQDQRLKVPQATGRLEGVDVIAKVDLGLGTPPETEEERERARKNALRRLEMIRSDRAQIRRGVDWLSRFEFHEPPVLVVDLAGDVDQPDRVQVDASFVANGFSYPGYECNLLTAEIGYDGQQVVLRQVHLQDELGELHATASWETDGKEVDFHLESSADLPAVADALLASDALREVVFYDVGPRLALEGTWLVPEEGSEALGSLRAVGEFQCGRFVSRGEVFEGLSARFGVREGGLYIRDGLLRHRTGTLALDLMRDEEQGLRHRTVLKMDPNAFVPFVKRDTTRQTLRRFSFADDSNIFVKLTGSGPTSSLLDCTSVGFGELRGVKHRGVLFDEADGQVEVKGKQTWLREMRLTRDSARGEVDEVWIDGENRNVSLTGVRAKGDPVPLVAAFAPNTSEIVRRYRLSEDTVMNLDGTIWWREPTKSDFRVTFGAEDGQGVYPLWGEEYVIESPLGELAFVGSSMDYNIRGNVFGAPLSAVGSVSLDRERRGFDVDLKAEAFEYEVFGKTLRFEGVEANVEGDLEATRAEIDSKLLAGDFSLSVASPVAEGGTRFTGGMQLDAVSFGKFAEIYASDYQTEGDLSGHFDFQGEVGDWSKLNGEGVAIIVNGNLYAVPILGPLTPLLGAFLPKPIKGYNVAKDANCTFSVADGKVVTDDVEALTTTFRLVSSGEVDYINNRVDFEAQARFRGLPGIVFRPFSELLEYRATGSVATPEWKPAIFGGTTQEEAGPMPAEEPKRGLFDRLLGPRDRASGNR